jgi:hypothetical protein
MDENRPFGKSTILEPRTLRASAVIKSSLGDEDCIVIGLGSSLSVRRPSNPGSSIHDIDVPGFITAMAEISGRSRILVTYRKRGVDYFNVYVDSPRLRPLCESGFTFNASLGHPMINRISLSNECDGIVLSQTHEGSIHVLGDLGGSSPSSSVVHINRISPILPIISMVLFPRGEAQYGVLTIIGDRDNCTDIRPFDLTLNPLEIKHVTSLPTALLSLKQSVKPSRVWFDHRNSTLVFIGGSDPMKSSAIACISISDAFTNNRTEPTHGPPLPSPVFAASPLRDEVYIGTAYGELYSLSTLRSGPKLSLIDESISVPLGLSFLNSSESGEVLITSEFGYSEIGRPGGPKRQVHVNIAPQGFISHSTDYRIITSVSGIGGSANLNRIKTSGLGVDVSEVGNSVQPEHAFVAGNFMILSWKERSIAFQITTEGLKETSEIKIPPDLIAAYAYGPNGDMCICINPMSVFVVSFDRKSSKETWKPPSNDWIVACDYCCETNVLVVATVRGVYRLDKDATQKIFSSDEEISCVAIHRSEIFVGDWSGGVCLVGSNQIVPPFPVIPRSIVVHSQGIIVGFEDGSVCPINRNRGGQLVAGTRSPVGHLPIMLRRLPGSTEGRLVGGDRPGIITPTPKGLETVELVNKSTGTLLFVRDIAGVSKNILWYTDKEGFLKCSSLNPEASSECHIQRRVIRDHTPVGVETFDSLGQVAVAVGSELVIYDLFELKELNRVSVGDDKITCMCQVSGDAGMVVVGTNNGSLIALGHRERSEWIEFARSENEGEAIVAIEFASDRFIVSLHGGRRLCVSQLSQSSPGRYVIEDCASLQLNLFGLCLSTFRCAESSFIRIALGGISTSVFLLTFNPEEGREGLTVTARDLFQGTCWSVELMSEDSLLMGDDNGNVYYLKLVEPVLGRLERLQGCNLGETPVTCIRRLGDMKSCWVCTYDGGISRVSRMSGEEELRQGEPVFEPDRLANPSTRDVMSNFSHH